MSTPTHKKEEQLRKTLLREYFENACVIVALQEIALAAAEEARNASPTVQAAPAGA